MRSTCWKSYTFLHSEATFAHKIFPIRYKLIWNSKTLRKRLNSSTTNVSRFIDSISSLAGIFVGKTKKNNSNTLTSLSRRLLLRTLNCIKLVPLESRYLKLSKDTKHEPIWTREDLLNVPQKKVIRIIEIRAKRGKVLEGAKLADKDKRGSRSIMLRDPLL